MIRRDKSQSGNTAADALAAYLMRVDIELSRAGLSRGERDETCRQIVEQFHDMLPVPAGQATPQQVDDVLGQLAAEMDYASEEVQSRGQLSRRMWHRFWIGTESVPLALNDGGRRRILWGELIKRLCVLALFGLSVAMIGWLFVTRNLFGALLFAAFFLPAFALSVIIMLMRMPVTSLPRADHWSVPARKPHRWAFVAAMLGGFALAAVLSVLAYLAWTYISVREVWPPTVESSVPTFSLLWLIAMVLLVATIWRRRERRRMFRRWAASESGT